METPKEDGIQVMLREYFPSGSRIIKSKLYSWLFENQNIYYKEILGLPDDKITEESKAEFSEYIKLEIVINNIQILEDFFRILTAFKFSTVDPVMEFRKRASATKFYDGLKPSSLTPLELLDYLGLPPLDDQTIKQNNLTESLSKFKETLTRAKDVYARYINLYTCYKHGNRVTVVTSYNNPEAGTGLYTIIGYLLEKGDRNDIVFIRLSDISEMQSLEHEIITIGNWIKENWFSSHKDGKDSFNVTIPFPKHP